MKNKWAQIMAILALIAIIWSILWTWMIVLFSNNSQVETELTQEQIEQIQELIKSQSWTTSTWELNSSWTTIEIN